MSLQTFVSEFLTFIEKREERLLSWGFYNVSWTILEIQSAFPLEAPQSLQNTWNDLTIQGHTIHSLLLQMKHCNLIYEVKHFQNSYRTRFAEGVRLLANLRQMFKPTDWATGPRLVSDIKLQIKPRQYPRRDWSAVDVWELLKPKCPTGHTDLLQQCFFALANQGGAQLNFAGFQVRAFEHIFEKYGSKGFSGSVICAGTGSGKTKAFYVPAYLRVVPELNKPPFTKIIAIYPRNVLLADQLREAISEAEKLRPVLESAGLRPIRFGALLGDTPYEHYFTSKETKKYHWKRRGNGSLIPYLKSPVDGRSDLLWRDEDRIAGRTCLYRAGQSQPDVQSGVLALTREELTANPPDVLFLSLEMLNKEMGNPVWKKAFGMQQGAHSPRLLLLDEVHAHEGLSGAQVAWVLRRWKHWARLGSLHTVGLSATLRDAPQHLSRVAGISPSEVAEFRPIPGLIGLGEMVAEGAEYNLAIKGDPASASSLLGTSIQVGMLLSRLLTPIGQAVSAPGVQIRPDEFYRKKVFGFSDNLDSVNRWFDDMSDAESVTQRHGLLASFRKELSSPDSMAKRRHSEEGQDWQLPRLIGHNLDNPLTVTRCTSQDPGADANSNLIIATSALEVGFDDPDVGIMLHHKRPRSMASFLQRKGRAGRKRGARPWTAVVLSDYGADRWTFHSAERLFDPELDTLSLPTMNPFVLRVQIAQYLIDWIGNRLGGNAYQLLQGYSGWAPGREFQVRARQLLENLLDQGQVWKEFEKHVLSFFQRASGLSIEDAQELLNTLLWHEPKPLVMQVIPSLLRKLEANWKYCYGDLEEDKNSKRPLPQFIPKATFEDLEVGEAVIEFEDFRTLQRDPETMSLARFLFEVCPGRVSKRFANFRDEPGYWHGFSAQLRPGDNFEEINTIFPQNIEIDTIDEIQVFEPLSLKVVHRPNGFNDTCNSAWKWQTVARVQGEGEVLPVRETNPWSKVFDEAKAFLHSNAEWIELVRYSEENNFELSQPNQNISGSLRLQKTEDDGKILRQAVGFKLKIDGVRFVLSHGHLNELPEIPTPTLNRFRADYFEHLLKTSPNLKGYINKFQAEWLSQMALAMLTATALAKKVELKEAQEMLSGIRSQAASKVLSFIFQMRGVSVAGTPEDAKLKQTLLDLWSNRIVLDEIEILERVLWDAPDQDFIIWVRQRYAATLAQAIFSAMLSLSQDISEDNLVVDVLRRKDNGYDLIISESSPGGLGQIETIVREMQKHPRQFLDRVEYALSDCPREKMSANLLGVAKVAAYENGSDIQTAFDIVRGSSGFEELEQAKSHLQSALVSRGFSSKKSMVVSVASKLLRPGTDFNGDKLLFRLNRMWRNSCKKLAIKVPLRTFAYTCACHNKTGSFISNYLRSIGGDDPEPAQLFAKTQQLLLDTCEDSCPECLDQKGRFYDLGLPSRALAVYWLDIEIPRISLDLADWETKVIEALRSEGRVQIEATSSQRSILVAALPKLVVEEIDLESRRATVSLSRVEQITDKLVVLLQIPDFIYG